MTDPNNSIAFQGVLGAYSHLACREAFPGMHPLPCASFEDALAAVQGGAARLAMIPVENSVHGRVADVHHLLPEAGLHIIGEHFQRVHHHLLALPGASIEGIRAARSHVQALGQTRRFLRAMGITPVVSADTAGAAKEVSELGDRSIAAIASSLAGEIYGLVSLREGVQDEDHNTTRMLVMAREADPPEYTGTRAGDGTPPAITSFIFQVRNVPAALYKAMGGFATNGVNMTKLESYMVGGHFVATRFYADIEGHQDDPRVRNAMEELQFFAKVTMLGCYPAHPYRWEGRPLGE